MGRLRRKAVWGFAVALWLLAPTTGSASSGSSTKADQILKSSSSGEPRGVIIRTKAGRRASVKNKVGRHTSQFQEFALLDALTAKLSAADIAELLNDPDVESVSVDADVAALAKNSSGTTTTTTTTSSSSVPLPLPTATSDLKLSLGLGNWYTGSGVTVAVIDSGIAPVLDFDYRLVASYDFTGGRRGTLVLPSDQYGHGTHVAGLIASSGLTSAGKYGGVAPGAKLLSLKVLDKKGSGKTSDVLSAIEFAVANKDRFGIKVVNLSLGHPIFEPAATDPLVQAVEAAVRSGLIVIVAAGNYGRNPVTGVVGYAGIASPGNAPSAITVGAAVTNGTVSRGDDRVAPFSSRGPAWYDGIAKPDVLAPGQALISNDVTGSTLDTEYPSLVTKTGTTRFLRLNGTSMSTGVVSGLVAVMLEASQTGAQQRWQAYQETLRKHQRTPFVPPPTLTANAVKAMLQYSATPLHNESGAVYGPLEQGTGLVNGVGAMSLAYFADTTKNPGDYWMTGTVLPSTNFGGTDEPWSQNLIWGTRLVRGTSAIDIRQFAYDDDNIVWGTGALDEIVWGTYSEEDDNIVWGTALVKGVQVLWLGNAEMDDNIVWGTFADWDDNIVWGTNLLGELDGDNIVWGTTLTDDLDNIVWGTLDDDNIVWGTTNKMTLLGLGGGVL